MNDATRTELLNLVQDYVIASDDYPEDVDALGYAELIADVYSACLDGTIDQVCKHVPSANEYLRVLAELGYDTRNHWQICETIVEQLGGAGRLVAMAGTPRNGGILVDAENLSVTIRFKGCRQYDRVQITLTSDDRYTVKFMKLNARTWELTREDETTSVPAENLVQLFETTTGLYLSI